VRLWSAGVISVVYINVWKCVSVKRWRYLFCVYKRVEVCVCGALALSMLYINVWKSVFVERCVICVVYKRVEVCVCGALALSMLHINVWKCVS